MRSALADETEVFMSEVTLESLARRVATLERLVQNLPASPAKDWRSAVGMFAGSAFMKEVDAAGQSIREQDRATAQAERSSSES
jgi:hypothetical protein